MPQALIRRALIRRAGPDDADTVSALGARTFTETFGHLYPPEDLAAFLAEAYGLQRTQADLADPAQAIWLVTDADEAIGYFHVGPCSLPHPQATKAAGELKRIYLIRSRQGENLGAEMAEIAFDWLEDAGRSDIWLGVWSQNLGAQRFYARRGFTKVGEYDFPVGQTLDHEFIMRRQPGSRP